MSGGSKKGFDFMKFMEDLVFKLTSRPKGKPADRMSQARGGLEAYWQDQGGAGGKPPGDQPGWGGGGQPEEPDDAAYSLGDLRKFLKEWGEYGLTILVFFVAYQALWPIAQWFEKIQESPRSIVGDVQQLFANISNAVKWVIGWGEQPDKVVVVDDEGRAWVNSPLCLAVNENIQVDVPGYEPEAPLAFDTLRYPNMSEEEKFALTNYYAARPWERKDPFQVAPQLVEAIEAKYEPNEADRKRWRALKAAGREQEYWASRRRKRVNPRTGEFETVSEGHNTEASELERLEADINRAAVAVGLDPVSSDEGRWDMKDVKEVERRVGNPFRK